MPDSIQQRSGHRGNRISARASDERIQQKALALEHTHYEVVRARRQYDAVDPENRLVTAELERRWNHALTTEAQLEAELTALQQCRERPLTDIRKRELIAFARDLPRLWDDPRSSSEHKKRLLRIALKEIVAMSEGETVRLVLHWEGEDHTQVVPKDPQRPTSACNRRRPRGDRS